MGKRIFNLSKDIEEGISQTINTARNNIGQLRYEVIPLSRIILDSNNPRQLSLSLEDLKEPALSNLEGRKQQEFNSLKNLAESIKKVGIRNAVEVYKEGNDYKLVSGERRVLASHIAQKNDIQARILDRRPSDFKLKLLQWVENIQREDLTTWERVNNVQQLISAFKTENKETITAQKLGEILDCSRQYATTLLVVVNSSNLIKEALKRGILNNLNNAALIARVEGTNVQKSLINACEMGATTKDLKKIIAINQNSKKRQFRQSTKGNSINMGVANSAVLKKLITTVLTIDEYSKYHSQFTSVEWENTQKVKKAFKLFLNILEKHEK